MERRSTQRTRTPDAAATRAGAIFRLILTDAADSRWAPTRTDTRADRTTAQDSSTAWARPITSLTHSLFGPREASRSAAVHAPLRGLPVGVSGQVAEATSKPYGTSGRP